MSTSPQKPKFAYVGSRTTRERNARGDGLSVFQIDPASGQLSLVQLVGDLVNPSFQALNQRGDRLYSVHGDQTEISVFAVEAASGRLTLLQTTECGGRNPVHLALSPTESHLVVSGHLSSLLAVLPVQADGTLGPVVQSLPLSGEPGPHRHEQPFAKPHFNPFTPDGRFVVVPDKGVDRVFSLRWTGSGLEPAAVPWFTAREGSGPRHVAFHPSQPWAYVVNELDSTVTACRYEADTGALRPFQILSALPDDFVGHSRAAEVEVSADGATVYVSNRGHDSIAVLRIDPATGRLALVQACPSGGRTPRFFALGPDGCFLYVLNEDSDTIVQLAVEAGSGLLVPTGYTLSCGSPVCLVWGRLPR